MELFLFSSSPFLLFSFLFFTFFQYAIYSMIFSPRTLFFFFFSDKLLLHSTPCFIYLEGSHTTSSSSPFSRLNVAFTLNPFRNGNIVTITSYALPVYLTEKKVLLKIWIAANGIKGENCGSGGRGEIFQISRKGSQGGGGYLDSGAANIGRNGGELRPNSTEY